MTEMTHTPFEPDFHFYGARACVCVCGGVVCVNVNERSTIMNCVFVCVCVCVMCVCACESVCMCVREIALTSYYRAVKTHRMPYLYRSFSVKQPHN